MAGRDHSRSVETARSRTSLFNSTALGVALILTADPLPPRFCDWVANMAFGDFRTGGVSHKGLRAWSTALPPPAFETPSRGSLTSKRGGFVVTTHREA